MKGQLPKAYLRIDPNLDHTHPDPGAFIRLLCSAARQPKRGRFKSRKVAEQALGKKRVAAFIERRDLIESQGMLEVDGWDIWQEGDFTVGERMRRFRSRHTTVTEALPEPSRLPLPPSEASRRQGVKAEGTEQQLAPADAAAGERPWNQRACDLVQRRYGGTAPGARITKALRPLVAKHGDVPVLSAFGLYLDETEAEFMSPERFATTYGHWAGTASRANPRPGAKQSVGEQAMRAAAEFIGKEGEE